MIDYDKLIRKARIAEREILIKYLKYRKDKNIYQRKETIIYWNQDKKIEKETRVSTEIRMAKNFADYCNPQNKNTIIEDVYLF